MVKSMSERGVAFLRASEGYRSKPYKDSSNVTTIGYGHTSAMDGIKIQPTAEWTIDYAEKRLRDDVNEIQRQMNHYLKKYDFNQNQYDALASYIFNRGIGTFLKSDAYKALENGNWDDVFELLKIDEKNRPGILNRRQSEANIWKYGDYTLVHQNSSKKGSSKKAQPTDPSTLNGQTQSSVNAQRQPPSDNQFHVPETVPQQPLQKGQNIQPPIGTPLNNTRSHGSDWPQNFDGAPSDPRGPFRVPQYTPNPNSNTPNNWPQPVRKKTSLFGSLGNIFKRNPTEVQQLDPTQLSPNQQQWNNSTESQQTDFRQLPLNQQPSTQHENIFKRIFNFLRFNIFHGGSR